MIRSIVLSALLLLAAAPLASQEYIPPQKLEGPRFGVTVVTGRAAEMLRDELDAGPVITQFGWQFETEFFRTRSGLAAVTELVPLAGGLEQGTLIPSLNWLVGMRTGNGTEFAVGPNLSAIGLGLVLAGGVTLRVEELNVPLNLAVVPSKDGLRVSFLSGFNIRKW